ncbi:hypothetical protein BCR35DRAFT_305403 [Leucosporidium creatinivorum]|uniref:YCII-related domain-containing protein n=1 Tax=Leucosporidium creatinivorum TaxID=106004 RepID=A0A1Y2F2B8_9BASI|nr:hypothetical protein BCR35DRAFT_305403 [Leucosporidium creatinivorum]
MSIFLVIAPDLPDSRRLSLRETHLLQSAVGRELGWNVNGGPTFSAQDPQKMDGSWLLLRGLSAEEVMGRVLRDIYAVEGAWDVEKIEVKKVGAKV